MRKLVIVEHEPLTPRLRQMLMLDELCALGLEWEYWDVTAITGTAIPGIVTPCLPETRAFASVDDLRQAAEESSSHAIFMVEVARNWRNRRLNAVFANPALTCIRVDFYANTAVAVDSGFRWHKLKRWMFAKRHIDIMLTRLYERMRGAKPRCQALLSSAKAPGVTRLINHPDYEAYKRLGDCAASSGRHIVFIDQYFPLHPDLEKVYGYKLRPGVTEQYRASLTRYFDYLESQQGLPVVVAAHPKSAYRGDEFGPSRSIVKGDTLRLVAEAEMVLCHASTALSYVMLARKKVAFIKLRAFDHYPDVRKGVERTARYCGLKAYDIDETPLGDIAYCHIPDDARARYIEGYIAPPEAADTDNARIIYDLVKRLS